jgi:hypothetical protein
MSLGSNGVDRARSLRKIPTRLRCTNYCTNCTCSAPVCTEFRAVTKRSETHQNMSLGSNGVDRVRSLRKIPTRLRCTNFCTNHTYSALFYTDFCRVKKRSETHQNMSLGSHGVDHVRSLRKTPTRLRCTNFCTNCTSSAPFCTEFRAVTKRSETHQNMSLGSNGVDRVRSL